MLSTHPVMAKKIVFNTVLCVWIRHYLYGCRSRSFHHQAKKKLFLTGILKVSGKKSRIRIRIRDSVARIRGPRPEPKCHGSTILLKNHKVLSKKKSCFKIYAIIKTMWEMQQIEYSMVRYLKKYDICRIEHSYSSAGKKPKSTTNIQCKIIL